MTIEVERSGLVAMSSCRAEAQGICSRSPVMLLSHSMLQPAAVAQIFAWALR
jgi:hypothetical protein